MTTAGIRTRQGYLYKKRFFNAIATSVEKNWVALPGHTWLLCVDTHDTFILSHLFQGGLKYRPFSTTKSHNW